MDNKTPGWKEVFGPTVRSIYEWSAIYIMALAYITLLGIVGYYIKV